MLNGKLNLRTLDMLVKHVKSQIHQKIQLTIYSKCIILKHFMSKLRSQKELN